MFKIMIVDDSPHIAHYLSNLIDWEDYDCILTGIYTNPRSLLADAAKDIPDAVFSDIAMPGMNGLELTEKLYALNPSLKIILISGYSEFSYAKRALELHVFDYLLKPVQLAQLQQLMKKLLSELKLEEVQRHKLNQEESQKRLHFKASLTHYLSRILFHTSSEEKICAELLRLGFPLPDAYHLYIASLDPCIPSDSYIYSRWESYHERIRIIPLSPDTKYGTLLILYWGAEEAVEISDLLSRLCIDIETQLHEKVIIGYSLSSTSFNSLPQLFTQALETLSALLDSETAVPLSSYADILHDKPDIEPTVKDKRLYSQLVLTMLEYIHSNYMHDISTKSVTSQVFLSSNYANSFFVKECGMTISDYLRHYRLEKGKELLVQTDENIARIAELVGYGSKTAFYLAFKRCTGQSPTEYRQENTVY